MDPPAVRGLGILVADQADLEAKRRLEERLVELQLARDVAASRVLAVHLKQPDN